MDSINSLPLSGRASSKGAVSRDGCVARRAGRTMKLVMCSLACLLGMTVPVRAQFQLNEIYPSHAGTDDMEFVEVLGPAGASLDGFMILVVEGDGAAAGTLDRAFDLSGLVVPADGYFVAGDTAVIEADLDIGASNSLENGTETFYLIDTPAVTTILARLGTDVDPDDDGVTDIATDPNVTIHDLVAMIDTGYPATDVVYDGALVTGPDGPFFPAGIYRGLDVNWCSNFLDFDLGPDRTPGAMNGPCQPVFFEGLEHTLTGTALARTLGGTLTLSNIGASGDDGVRLDVGRLTGDFIATGGGDPFAAAAGPGLRRQGDRDHRRWLGADRLDAQRAGSRRHAGGHYGLLADRLVDRDGSTLPERRGVVQSVGHRRRRVQPPPAAGAGLCGALRSGPGPAARRDDRLSPRARSR